MTLLAIMGSGETSPTMVSVHRRLAAPLPAGASAILLETPYGFQENVADISAKACGYFATSVSLDVAVAPGLRTVDPAPDTDRGLAAVRSADWVFSGPGSPTYAMDCWRSHPVGQALRDRLARPGGVTVLASAAAATLGRWAVPVYEIYKVGAPAHWVAGLDLMSRLGLPVAVIPHYDNTEGGTHDTRFCYLGERRLRTMEAMLPAEAAVLGVDEHTAMIIDQDTGALEVVGRGRVTVRRSGAGTVLPAGTVTTLTHLRALTRGDPGTWAAPIRSAPPPAAATVTVSEIAVRCERRFEEALARRDAAGLGQAVLDLEVAVREWSADTEQDDGAVQAAAVLRTLIVRLAGVAQRGLADPVTVLAPVVDPLVAWRDRLRAAGDFTGADDVRAALTAVGVVLRDTPDRTRWSLRPAA
ncbi:hypothetical protein [Actinoplanes sp. NPDC051494]|uniref:hypothetical protein n=1 Tax=Actinoplanes sp. NPDC051494 TaxID=3363907 RepID=UPI0037AC451E